MALVARIEKMNRENVIQQREKQGKFQWVDIADGQSSHLKNGLNTGKNRVFNSRKILNLDKTVTFSGQCSHLWWTK